MRFGGKRPAGKFSIIWVVGKNQREPEELANQKNELVSFKGRE